MSLALNEMTTGLQDRLVEHVEEATSRYKKELDQQLGEIMTLIARASWALKEKGGT
jgi:hypothetical protein